MDEDDRRRRCAYHEAGHAVVMILRDVPLARVSIESRDAVQDAGGVDRRALVAASLAGCIAEDRFRGCADPTERVIAAVEPLVRFETGDAGVRSRLRPEREPRDFRIAAANAVRAAVDATGLPKPQACAPALVVLQEEKAATLRLVDARYAAVVALVRELLERGTIEGAEATEIVHAH